jgi:antitoxin component YwqK of YwqJK toxin-antitoxin module
MSILHDAYIALLAGLTHKTGNEIYWQDENNKPITIEPIDIESKKYIIRYYYPNGQKKCEAEYQNDQRHGKYLRWYENGQKECETEYKNDQIDGKYIEWHENGQKNIEKNFKNSKLHGKSSGWYSNGKRCYIIRYKNNKRCGKAIWWHSDNQKWSELEYENDTLISVRKLVYHHQDFTGRN